MIVFVGGIPLLVVAVALGVCYLVWRQLLCPVRSILVLKMV